MSNLTMKNHKIKGDYLYKKDGYTPIGKVKSSMHPSYKDVFDNFGNKVGSIHKDYYGKESFMPTIPIDRGGWPE